MNCFLLQTNLINEGACRKMKQIYYSNSARCGQHNPYMLYPLSFTLSFMNLHKFCVLSKFRCAQIKIWVFLHIQRSGGVNKLLWLKPERKIMGACACAYAGVRCVNLRSSSKSFFNQEKNSLVCMTKYIMIYRSNKMI